jgi:hypothetical protein
MRKLQSRRVEKQEKDVDAPFSCFWSGGGGGLIAGAASF